MSSTEAEYIEKSSCISELPWMSGLMTDVFDSMNLHPVQDSKTRIVPCLLTFKVLAEIFFGKLC